MKIVTDLVQEGGTIIVDDVAFMNCEFTDCEMIFQGGDVALIDTKIVRCRIALVGAAAKTARMLQMFGWSAPERPEITAGITPISVN